MGHFPFVHDGLLGSEPRTEVVDYNVHVDGDTNEVWATECQFWQPAASATAT
ncbi:MAG: aromatic ring-hydroxylating dioxygenase subunit alpha, partial [Acidimicrobiaceae bacterium]|nr:aromatic ring-hydroxylating dioxygenase subunit alpha [Acidimicrobiaceae bacterium]